MIVNTTLHTLKFHKKSKKSHITAFVAILFPLFFSEIRTHFIKSVLCHLKNYHLFHNPFPNKTCNKKTLA